MARIGTDKQLKSAKKQCLKAKEEVELLNDQVYINYNPDLNKLVEQAEQIIEKIEAELNRKL